MARPSSFIETWRLQLQNRRFLWLLISGVIFVIFAVRVVTVAVSKVDTVKGYFFHDPILELFPAPMDFSNIIFFITYSSTILLLSDLILKSPSRLVAYGFAFGATLLLRSATIYLIPLEPPKGMILLLDPIVMNLSPTHIPASKDLFYSGHTASIVLMLCTAYSRWLKNWLFLMCLTLPVLIMWQRVHYTIDIAGAVAVGIILFKLSSLAVNMLLEGSFFAKRQLSGGHL